MFETASVYVAPVEEVVEKNTTPLERKSVFVLGTLMLCLNYLGSYSNLRLDSLSIDYAASNESPAIVIVTEVDAVDGENDGVGSVAVTGALEYVKTAYVITRILPNTPSALPVLIVRAVIVLTACGLSNPWIMIFMEELAPLRILILDGSIIAGIPKNRRYFTRAPKLASLS